MTKEITLPVDGFGWLPLSHVLGNKIVVRAGTIEIKKQRVRDTDGHSVDEADAKRGVKIRPKLLDITSF
ncbi:MAG TPA: hypothetical protein VJI67_04455 [archaeon]|nr:hypothetical protein [archaeon]HLD81239.1 hypothetical protein [archaeon]